MKNNIVREISALQIYKKYWDSYSKGDVETFASTLDETFEMIGTSETEICHTKVEGIEFLKAQIKEIVGKVEMRNRQIQKVTLNPVVLINECCDLYVLNGKDWNFYSKIRISTLLRNTEFGWKVVQQHGSLPDIRVDEGETLAIEKISKENLRLRDAVKRRTAELENKNHELAIEAALEKVRTVAMSMRKPEDMLDVCIRICEQLEEFGVSNIRNVQTAIIDAQSGQYLCFQYFPAYSQTTIENTEYLKSPVEREMVKHMLSSRNGHFIGKITGKDLEDFRSHRKKENHFPDPFLDTAAELSYCFLSIGEGGLGLSLYEAMAEGVLSLFQRFHQVFSLTYQRFRDIQLVEESARATKKQASLDRIRADISAMRHAEDLNRVTPLVFNELTSLGIPLIRCGVFIVHEKEKNLDIYLSTPEGKSLAAMTMPFGANQITARSVKAWKKGEVFIQHWNQDDFIAWGRSLQEQGYVSDLKAYQGADKAPESLHLNFVPFTQGLLYVGSPDNLTETQINLVKELTKSFAIAYARYEDFVKLEQAKTKVESAMSELKATQSQLIQREKLASLGQLTAGIAHEIKNPLNFVNNFSEVSIELLEEVMKEIQKLESRDELFIKENLEDIKFNLQKISEHGTRANAIVTSMMQHSRGGSSKMELTDLNDMVSEYVHLSYQGMRTGKNPIHVTIEFDLDDAVKKVKLIREEFSRVLLNLCNNAFDAMRQKNLDGPKGYAPKLSIRTKAKEKYIIIEIEDNGCGIPNDIKDKILQPFFTTKKGTEGTGLGLSITHDIVKAHGGDLKVESQENLGTTISISLETK